MGLQQHHRDAVLLQLAVQPGRPTGRLVADEQQPVRIRLKRLPDRFGVGGHTGLQRDLAVLGFDDADRSCGGGSVECGMVLHRGASSLAGCNNTPTLRLPVHHGEIARRWPNYAVNPSLPLMPKSPLLRPLSPGNAWLREGARLAFIGKKPSRRTRKDHARVVPVSQRGSLRGRM